MKIRGTLRITFGLMLMLGGVILSLHYYYIDNSAYLMITIPLTLTGVFFLASTKTRKTFLSKLVK
jgi:hypothetical protein